MPTSEKVLEQAKKNRETLDMLKLPWDRVAAQPHGKAVIVSVIVSEYLKSQKYLSVGLGTKRQYQSAIRLFDNLILANGKTLFQMYAHKVNYGTVDYINSILSHTYAAGTIRYNFTVMSNVWEHAMRTGRVVMNPWSKPGIRVNNERDQTWTREQVKNAVEVAENEGYHTLALYILFAYETGIRMWSDLRRLTWDMIKTDAEGKTTLEFTIAKTGVHLMLPISRTLLHALKSTGTNEGYIFANIDGKLLTSQCVYTHFKKVKKKAMLPENLQLRDLRRTAVTELVTAGATDREIAAITGWRNPASVINRYARVRLQTAENGMNKRWAEREKEHTTTFGETQCS